MEKKFICPNCQAVEYFFDGDKLQCPNCNQNDFEVALHQSEGNIEYQELSKLNKPFLELVFGEIYDCDVTYNGKIEKTTIVPINSNPKFNQLFFLFDVNYCEQNNPNIVETLMNKSFSELWDLEIKHEFFDKFDCSIIIGATSNDNSIISYDGWIFKNLVRKELV